MDDTSNTMPDGSDSTNALLQEELRRMRDANRALVEEFSNPKDSADSPEKVRDAFFPHVPMAINQIVNLAQFSQSESVRSANSKYIIDMVVGKKLPIDPEDENFKKLLESLMPDAKTT